MCGQIKMMPRWMGITERRVELMKHFPPKKDPLRCTPTLSYRKIICNFFAKKVTKLPNTTLIEINVHDFKLLPTGTYR